MGGGIPHLKSVMTPFPHAVTLDDPVPVARELMRRHGVRHLPVKDEAGTLVGVLTDRDLKLALGPYLDLPTEPGVAVRHACVLDAFTMELEAPLDKVLEAMVEQRLGSVLVTKEGRLAGIFTTVDACRVLAELLRERRPDGDQAA